MSNSSKKPKYIFVSGGVISGIGKGIAAASIGMLLKQRGLTVEFIKCDPYINVDAGTMNPMEHGEVFVTDDGYEMDMDAGHYERFLDQPITKASGITTGQVYLTVIQNERNLKYGGVCVEVVPHIVDEIVNRIKGVSVGKDVDIVLVEIGGTVGEYQNEIYYEAERRMMHELKGDLLHIHLVYLPIPESLGEMKTKPGQQSVRLLNNLGIFPNIVLARAHKVLDAKRIQKMAMFCGVEESMVFSAPDVSSIYEVPINFEEQNIADAIIKELNLEGKLSWNKEKWVELVNHIKTNTKEINIGIVGKYFATGDYNIEDAYASVIESIKHASWNQGFKPNIHWLNAETVIEKESILEGMDGIIVPGGFGERGVEGKIKAVKYAREHKIPYLGLCYGMQIAVIEFARDVCGLQESHTTEIKTDAKDPVIHIMPDQEKKLMLNDYGASMRLGKWDCKLVPGTVAYTCYGDELISERHRHRYEFNNKYKELLTQKGLIISGTTTDETLVEIVELPKTEHPFFVGVQFHPEFKSRPLRPHPLFAGFVAAAGTKEGSN